jgi:hypothetical protein
VAVNGMRLARGRGRRKFVPFAVLGLLALIAAVGGRATAALLFVLFAVLLPAIVVMHWRLLRAKGRRRTAPRALMFRSPIQLALAVVLVASGGTLTVVLVSVLLAVAASAIVGDGSTLVRLLLVSFVLWPCVALGRRCGRWWAFVGAAGLVPLLGFAMLVAGPGASTGAGFLVVAVLGTASALALGSLQSEWEARATKLHGRGPVARTRERVVSRRKPPTPAPAASADGCR